MFNIGFLLILSFIIVVFGIFMYIFTYEVIGEYGITIMKNVSNDLHNQGLFSDEINTYINERYNNYYSLNILPDLLSLFLLVSFYLYALTVAITSKKQRNLEFFGNLTVLNMLLLLIMSIISQVLKWFWNEFFEGVLYNLNYSTTTIEFIVNHSSEIFFFMFVSLVLINKLEFFGRAKKETYELDDLEQDFIEEDLGVNA